MTPPTLSAPSAAAVKAAVDAVKAKKLYFFSKGPYCSHYAAAPATTVLAHNAFTGDQSHDNLVLEQARYLLSDSGFGDRGPNFGIAWYSQSQEANWCTFLAYLPWIDRLWAKLSAIEKRRIDLMMTMAPIAAVWHAAKNRPVRTTIDGGTLATGQNPNLDSSWLTLLCASIAYWQATTGGKGIAKVQSILEDVQISSLELQASSLGLTSIRKVLANVGSKGGPSAAQIRNTLANAKMHYRLSSTFPATDIMELVRERTLFFFSKPLEPGQNGGKGIDGRATVSSGVNAYPYSGIGDAFEFGGKDDGGVRSSGTYVAEGMRHVINALLLMVIAGFGTATTTRTRQWSSGSASAPAAASGNSAGARTGRAARRSATISALRTTRRTAATADIPRIPASTRPRAPTASAARCRSATASKRSIR